MSPRRQETGTRRQAAQAAPQRPQGLRPGPRPRRDRHLRRRRERSVLLLGLAAILLVLAVPAYGYVATFVLPPRTTVVKVNDSTYSMGDLLKTLRVFQRGAETSGEPMNMGTLPFQVVATLAENELISQAAPRYGIAVTPEEVDREVRARILGQPDPQQLTPLEQLDREFRERYRQYLNLIQLSEEEHRAIVRMDLYRDRMREHLGQEIPAVLPQVHLYMASVKDEEAADRVRTEFARGALFGDLVERYDGDPEAVRRDGEIGWIPRGLSPGLDQLVFDTLAPGQLSDPYPEMDPATNQTLLRIYLVTEKAEAREVTQEQRETLMSRALADWIQEERGRTEVFTRFDSAQYDWLVKQLTVSATRQQ